MRERKMTWTWSVVISVLIGSFFGVDGGKQFICKEVRGGMSLSLVVMLCDHSTDIAVFIHVSVSSSFIQGVVSAVLLIHMTKS